jgi:hypothetical protein
MVKASSPRVGGYSLGFFPALVNHHAAKWSLETHCERW